MLTSAIVIGVLSVVVMIALIYGGLHVAISLMTVSFVSIAVLRDNFDVALSLLALTIKDGISSYSFAVVPLFVLMGALIAISDIGKDLYAVSNLLFRRIQGGLGIATVAANTVFAAVTGVSIASSVIFSKIAVPEMRRHGYNKRFAVGVVAGSSVLGMLIPPSVLLIVYALIAQVSVRDMFVAGILPGLLLAAFYAIGILLMARFMPGFVWDRNHTQKSAVQIQEGNDGLCAALMRMSPVLVLIGVMFGGIYGGVFTATEAGAIGCLSTLILTIVRGKLTVGRFLTLVAESGRTTASILIIILAALMYSRMLGVAGVPSAFSSWLASMDISVGMVLLIYVLAMLLLGTILDATSTILVLVPLFLPVTQAFDLDLVWFGIVTVVGVEIGLLTPPLGLTCFVVKGALEDKDITLADIFLGALPFAVIMLTVLTLLILFPAISLALV